MAVRIRQDGTILCAALHPEAPGDTYLHDGLHYKLSVELGALVTEPMHSDEGRGGHAAHGEWWWRHEIPADVVIEDRLGGATEAELLLRVIEDGYMAPEVARELFRRCELVDGSNIVDLSSRRRGA